MKQQIKIILGILATLKKQINKQFIDSQFLN